MVLPSHVCVGILSCRIALIVAENLGHWKCAVSKKKGVYAFEIYRFFVKKKSLQLISQPL